MRKKKSPTLVIRQNCPFCGRTVDITDKDTDSFIRENKYLQKARQYFHKTCYQKFYNIGEEIEYDRATVSNKKN